MIGEMLAKKFLSVFNIANGLVRLDSTGKIPALDGSLLTNLPAAASSGWTVIARTTDSAAVNNSTTFVDDGVLQFAVEANKDYIGEFVIFISTTAVADWKCQLTGPASPTSVRIYGQSLQSAGAWNAQHNGTPPVITAFSTALDDSTSMSTASLARIQFHIQNGANAGTVALQFAQLGADANDTKNLRGSYVMYMKTN